MLQTGYGLLNINLDELEAKRYYASPIFWSLDPQEIIKEYESGKGYKLVQIYNYDEYGQDYGEDADYEEPERFIARMSNTSAEDWHKAFWHAIFNDDEDLEQRGSDWYAVMDKKRGSYNLEEAKKMLRARREEHPDAYIVVIDDRFNSLHVVDTIREI